MKRGNPWDARRTRSNSTNAFSFCPSCEYKTPALKRSDAVTPGERTEMAQHSLCFARLLQFEIRLRQREYCLRILKEGTARQK